MEEYDFLFKIIIIGDSGVGKSCLLIRYADNTYNESYLNTIGVDFKIKTTEVANKIIKLQLWDTAGEERFRTITSSYYRGANAVIIVFDPTCHESFLNVKRWLGEAKKYNIADNRIILISTKDDVSDTKKIIDKSAIEKFASDHHLKYFNTSAKKNTGVTIAFEALCSELMLESASFSKMTKSITLSKVDKPSNGNTRPIHDGDKCCQYM